MTHRPPPQVDIALTAFNSERYLDAFIASLEAQSHTDWRIVVRDDGSGDSTPAKLALHSRRLGSRARLLEDGDGNLGVVAGFSRVLSQCDAPYLMWADQDDVWLPHKVEVSLNALIRLEAESSTETPCLVFTDLVVADAEGRPVADSFWRYERIRPERAASLAVLSRGVVTGCTVIMNRALQRIVLPIPEDAISHDWWASIMAFLCGRLGPLHEATLLYRQHGGNDLGAKERSPLGYLRRLGNSGKMVRKLHSLAERTRRQAAAAYERAMVAAESEGVVCDADRLEAVREYAEVGTRSALARRVFYLKNGIIREDPLSMAAKYLTW